MPYAFGCARREDQAVPERSRTGLPVVAVYHITVATGDIEAPPRVIEVEPDEGSRLRDRLHHSTGRDLDHLDSLLPMAIQQRDDPIAARSGNHELEGRSRSRCFARPDRG